MKVDGQLMGPKYEIGQRVFFTNEAHENVLAVITFLYYNKGQIISIELSKDLEKMTNPFYVKLSQIKPQDESISG